MADSELRALGDLAAEYADKALTSTVQGVHAAVSARVFEATSAGSAAAQVTHDAISDTVYGALRLGGRGVGAAIAGASYHFVSGGLTSGERHPVATAFGDLLVRRHSATGPMTPDGEPVGDARHVQGANHFHLLNHPRVYEHLKTWLAGAESAEPAVLSFNA